MKIYTFKTNNKENNNISTLKNNIFNSYKNKYDWWGTLNNNNINYNTLNNLIYSRNHNIVKKPKVTYMFDVNNIPFNVYLNNKYVDYLDPIEEDDYDLMINNVPVKVFDSFIQYGYELIPFKNADLYHSPKKTIIDIITTIKIKKY